MELKLTQEDEIPFKIILNKIADNSKNVLRVIDAMNLGRSSVENDGVYRVFNDGSKVKIMNGSFTKKRLPKNTYKF